MKNHISLKFFLQICMFLMTNSCLWQIKSIYAGKRDQINESECNKNEKKSVLLNVTILVTTLV